MTPFDHPQPLTHYRFAVLSAALVIVIIGMIASLFSWQWAKAPAPAMLFQSYVPIETVPPSWVAAATGGVRTCTALKVIAPIGFTNQGGANIICDQLTVEIEIDAAVHLPNSEFALGIWPPNDQTRFLQPIELRMQMDTAQLERNPTGLVLAMFNPDTGEWLRLPTELRASTSELVGFSSDFMPLVKTHPQWGGRTLIAVHKRSAPAKAPTAAPTAAPTVAPTVEPTSASTALPTKMPTAIQVPSAAPTGASSVEPTSTPTARPTKMPTALATQVPPAAPTAILTQAVVAAAVTADPTVTTSSNPTPARPGGSACPFGAAPLALGFGAVALRRRTKPRS